MKIILVHNTYQWPGGEDVVVEQERDLLRSAGHEVLEYLRSNHEIAENTLVRRITLAQRTVWSMDTFDDFRALLRKEKPDIVHVHNTFVVISPSIYWACSEEGVPVVQTLHNFRLLCPQGTFLRDGKICEECTEHSLLRSLTYGCFHGSRFATGATALLLATHRWAGTWNKKIDRYIAVSQFARKKFELGGLPAKKLVVKPHFVYPDPGERARPGDYALFIGRLTPEKGLANLLDAWKQIQTKVPLIVVGDGPLRKSVEAQAQSVHSCVVFRGHLSRAETIATVKGAKFLLCTSECYEQGPATILESFACGVPVVAPSLGPIDEVVDDGHTGLLFRPGDRRDLIENIEWALGHEDLLAKMGRKARAKFETHYSAEKNYTRLMDIYKRVIAEQVHAVPLHEPNGLSSSGVSY
jgi:glycosyltransferase involved in cell wall biosynthesis